MATSNVSLERQAALRKEIASANFLRLNAQKCEVAVLDTARVMLLQSVRWMDV